MLALLVSCGQEARTPEPNRPIEGRWNAKVRIGERSFIDDTLELLPGGKGNAHRLELTLAEKEGGLDSSTKDFGRKEITWRVVTDQAGRNLCIGGQAGPGEDCGPLTIVSDSVMNLGNFVYRFLGEAPKQP